MGARSGRDEPRGQHIDRRDFLKGAGAAGVGAALAVGLPGIASAGTQPAWHQVPAFRLSTRGVDACNACKGHGANKYFRTRHLANILRAHIGCNCKILRQQLTPRQWNRYFVRSDGSLRRLWDTRWHQ
jgi:hypothetical protein